MVDAVSSVSLVQNATLKQSAQSEDASAASATASATASSAADQNNYVSSSIFMDNLQNVAILEYRSLTTGEVVQQYPTQSQIDAFKRAEHLSQKFHHTTEVPVPEQSAAPHVAITSAKAPSAPAPAAATTASSGGDAGGGNSGGSTTSVLA